MYGVIFDFDGTILDSETPEFESHRRFFSEHGVHLAEDEWCTGVGIAQPATQWWEWLCARAAAPPSFEAFREATLRYFREDVRMEPMPGIRAVVGALVAAGVPRAIASSGTSEWVLRAAAELGLAPSFDAIVTGDQVGRGKPAPDVYLEAARRLDIPARHCVAVEDSGPGVAAALAAGMRVVAIPHPVSRTHDFSGAHLEVSSAAELTLDTLLRLAGVDSRPIGSEKITGG